jgi:hypothetical protein
MLTSGVGSRKRRGKHSAVQCDRQHRECQEPKAIASGCRARKARRICRHCDVGNLAYARAHASERDDVVQVDRGERRVRPDRAGARLSDRFAGFYAADALHGATNIVGFTATAIRPAANPTAVHSTVLPL